MSEPTPMIKACQKHHMDPEFIRGPVRRASVMRVRREIARDMRRDGAKLIEIAEALGRKHSTVLRYLNDQKNPNGESK